MNDIDFTEIGYDYALKPYFMIIGDMEFSELFSKAECIGMLYIFGKTSTGEMIPAQMAFLFKNEEPAEKFMDIIMGWVERSNNEGDAVALDFIENKKGGYTISISPEINRFMNRMIPNHLKEKVNPIIMLQSHFKEIDNLGENYLNFKKNYKKAEKIAVGYVIGTPSQIVKQSKKYFVKREFNFYSEDEIPKNSTASSYTAKKMPSDFNPKDFSIPHHESLDSLSQKRKFEMNELLPITYNKLSNNWLKEILIKMSTQYDIEVIKQAICNLTVFERLKREPDLDPNFTKTGYPLRILEYLLSTYETFDSYYPPDDFYTEEKIVKQIDNDKREIDSYLKK